MPNSWPEKTCGGAPLGIRDPRAPRGQFGSSLTMQNWDFSHKCHGTMELETKNSWEFNHVKFVVKKNWLQSDSTWAMGISWGYHGDA